MGKTTFKQLTTFRIGGKIKYYRKVSNDSEIISAIKFARENNLQIFIIGEGSDILVSDNDFNGLVIKYIGKKIKLDNHLIIAEAGEVWDDLVKYAVKNNLQGIECLSGIPGTVGAAPIQNIGAYGQELKDIFVSLKAYDVDNEKFVEFSNDDCKFKYRESIFKTREYWQKFLITEVKFKLNKYEDKELDLQDIRNEILRVRSEKFENPKIVGNAGSFFKNPTVNDETLKLLLERFSDLKHFGLKLSAGWLIEKVGWKGKNYKSAGVSKAHALILVNPEGRAKAQDVLELSEKIIEDVHGKFGIELEREVQLINF